MENLVQILVLVKLKAEINCFKCHKRIQASQYNVQRFDIWDLLKITFNLVILSVLDDNQGHVKYGNWQEHAQLII